jgi:predicted RNA-binding Zn-ribbon protein involved in translation (DUF1610 family)
MTGMLQVQNEERHELVLTGRNGDDKRACLRMGLLLEQRLTCANHSDEDVSLDQTGWQSFRCPKCGDDYSIGRKITQNQNQKLKL